MGEMVMGLGSGMTRPMPACQPSTPRIPEAQSGINGVVLVGFTVHSDGHVDDIELKNPTAPAPLFEATKEWLLHCPFIPSQMAGKPIAVRVNQVFNFKQARSSE